MRNRTLSLIATLNAKQEVAVKKAKEDQAAHHMTRVKSRTSKSAGRLIDDGVSLQTQLLCSHGNLVLMYIVNDMD